MKLDFLALILCLMILTSCSTNSPDDLVETDPEVVTYTTNIKSIIDSNCVGCHGNPLANGAPFPMVTYDELVQAITNRNVIGRMRSAGNPMPPAGLLPSTTVDLIQQWIDDGFPE